MASSKPHRCDNCRADVEQNYLRMTKCLDGELRRLCEYCAIDEEQAKEQQRQIPAVIASHQKRAS